MKSTLILRVGALAAAALIVAASFGCGVIGRPNIPPEKEIPAAATVVNPLATAQRLHCGDNLTVRIDAGTSERQEHAKIVDEFGNIDIPLAGKVKVVDLTQAQAQDAIVKALVPRFYNYVTVTVQSQTPRQVFLTGEVRQPGAVVYREDMTVLRVIILQGGFNDFADRRNVVLTRGDKQLRLDCVDIERHPEKDVPLLPGDTIKVPKGVL